MNMRILVLLVTSIVSSGCASNSVVGLSATVTIAPGLTPQMTPDQVADIVVDLIHKNETDAGTVLRPPKILRMTATTGSHIGGLVGGNLVYQAEPGILWFVRVEGTFSTGHGLEATGYYLIADADGSVLEFGFP